MIVIAQRILQTLIVLICFTSHIHHSLVSISLFSLRWERMNGHWSFILQVSGLDWECPAEMREILAKKQIIYILLLAE